ncbi:MAG: replicative DNA helicase [Planctomycetota bacterium]|nr:replicative DNA helicase [Planctomycetota bacterium]
MEERLLQPPCSLDAESATLGSILLAPEVLHQIIDVLSAEDFYEPRNAKIFNAMRSLYLENERVDSVTVVERLRQEGCLQDVGGVSYIGALMESTPESSHAEYYAKIVKEKSILRELILTCTKIREAAYAQNLPAEELLEFAEQAIFKISHFSTLEESVALRDILIETFALLDKRLEGRDKFGGIIGIPTGYTDLDYATGGLQPGEFIVLGARPSMGKTTFALNITERVAVRERKPVGFFSIETSKDQLARNLLCIHSRVNTQKMRSGYTNSEENERLSLAVGELSEAPIFIDDTNPLTPLLLKAKARRLKAKYDVSLIVVDYLQLMHIPELKDNPQQEVSQISRHLKSLAKELKVPVLAISQLRRAAEEHGRPRLSDLRESGAIEQDADIVLFLYREDYQSGEPKPKGIAELIIAKQRHGPTTTINLYYDLECLRFENATAPREDLDELEISDSTT